MSSTMYLDHAAKEREAASKTNLPNRRDLHEWSAAVWEQMARNVEATAERAQVNLQAKNG